MTPKKTDKQALTELVMGLETDIKTQLQPWLSGTNIFDILSINGAEIRHSNFLAWLLNPSAQPVLKDAMVKQLLLKLIENGQELPLSPLDIMLGDFSDLTVEREREHMDIFMQSQHERLVLVIENKLFTGQHDEQLKRYRDSALAAAVDPRRIVLIYLTINADDPENPAWVPLAHSDIYQIISELLPKLPDGREKFYVQDYLKTLRVTAMNDEELKTTVDAIYNKYKQALDLIIANRPDEATALHDDVLAALQELQKTDPRVSLVATDGGHTYVRFRTTNMDALFADVLPLTAEMDSWANGSPYFWQFRMTRDYKLVLELPFRLIDQKPAVVARINEILIATKSRLITEKTSWRTLRKKWQVHFANGNKTPEEIVADDSYSQAEVLRVITELVGRIAKFQPLGEKK